MPRATWPLRQGCPSIGVLLTLGAGNQPLPLDLLADTGAGSATSAFDLLLEESDCLLCGGKASSSLVLGGAYAGRYTLYVLRVQIPALSLDDRLAVVDGR